MPEGSAPGLPAAEPWLRVGSGHVDVLVRVVPRSSRSRVAGVVGDRLKVQVTSPPVDGEANAAVLLLLARTAGLAPRDAEVVAGQTGRSKTVRLSAVDTASVADLLQKAAASVR